MTPQDCEQASLLPEDILEATELPPADRRAFLTVHAKHKGTSEGGFALSASVVPC